MPEPRNAVKQGDSVKMSELFGTTLRESPLQARTPGHALLLRAGYLFSAGQGRTSWLSLARRTLAHIETIARREMEAVGGQEILLPAGAGTELFRSELRSWRQLPVTLFQVRSTDSLHLEVFSATPGPEEQSSRFAILRAAFTAMLTRSGVPFFEAERALPEGLSAVHFISANDVGKDEIARCACGYLAPWSSATFRVPQAPRDEEPAPCSRVATPGCTTIDQLCKFFGIPETRTAKAVMLTASIPRREGAEERFVFAVVRGDREMSEAKLREALGADSLRPATEAEIRAAGAVPGYASAVGLSPKAIVVTDPIVVRSVNLVAGANEEGFHFVNVNAGRDFPSGITCDIAQVKEGDPCPRCGSALERGSALILGSLKMIRVTDAALRFQDRDGRERPVSLFSGELELGRILFAAAEAHNDERGLLWPGSIAPFDVHLISLGEPGSTAFAEAERLCGELEERGVGVMFDDRGERAGVKFADADLVGIPLRITVSTRGLESGSVEIKLRAGAEKLAVPRADAAACAAAMIGELRGKG
jgi:prolyl-tRNA synthetase